LVTTATTPEQGPSDAELITASRAGSSEAYAELYNRHRAAAYNLARQLARSSAEADDLVSEAFAKLLDTVRAGGGPDTAFRAYLLTALRHFAYDRTRRDRRIELSDDVSSYDPGVPFTDTAVAGLDRSLAARAFATLPERWQAVLWHTEIEGQPPAEIAPLFGLSPNGVAALAYRAREGLRQAYLQMHLADRAMTGTSKRELQRCRAVSERLGAWIRGGLSRRETAQVEQHLDECDRCRTLATELADVNGGLRAFVAPLVLGGSTAAYLASTGAKTATAASAGATATAGAGTIAGMGTRQLLAIGGSAAALAAAVVAGILTGPVQQAESEAAQPPARSAPVRPSSQPPSQPTPQVTQSQEPTPGAPAQPQPSLTAAAPSQEIVLDAGGGPVTLPITIHNVGGMVSAPVTVRLSLPGGVTATGTGAGDAPVATPFQWAPGNLPGETRYVPGEVSCAGGTGTISCSTEQGLPPEGSMRFAFALRAAVGASSGTVTGTVSSDIDIGLPAISVVVRPAPDLLDLQASALAEAPWRTRLNVLASNTGRTSGPVTAAIALPEGVFVTGDAPGCQGTAGTITCTGWLAAGQQAGWQLVLGAQYKVTASATVTANLGTAQRQATVPLDLDIPCQGRQHGQHGQQVSCPPGHDPGGPNGPGQRPHGPPFSTPPGRGR
jgi:RNA polymerase sigma factor (sigma-70 family)